LTAAKPSHRAALTFDRLDSRCLLSIAGPVAHVDGRDLIVDGTPKNDTVNIAVHASTIDVTSFTTVVIKGVPKKSPVSTVTYSTSDVDSINVNGNAGNDTLSVVFTTGSASSLAVTLKGGKGNDHLENRGGSNVTMIGGPGFNTVRSFGGGVTADHSSSPTGANVNLVQGIAHNGYFTTDKVIGINKVIPNKAKPKPKPLPKPSGYPERLTGYFYANKTIDGTDILERTTNALIQFDGDNVSFTLQAKATPGQKGATYHLDNPLSLDLDQSSFSQVIDTTWDHQVDYRFYPQGSLEQEPIGIVGNVTSNVNLVISPSRWFPGKKGVVEGQASLSGLVSVQFQAQRYVNGYPEGGYIDEEEDIIIRGQGVTYEFGSKKARTRDLIVDFSTTYDLPPESIWPPQPSYSIVINVSGY